MEFNPRTCIILHITGSITQVPSQYLLHDQVLESVEGSRFLAVEISNNLSFNYHIQNITASASRFLGFLKRNIRSQTSALREMSYETYDLVRLLVEYSKRHGAPTPNMILTALKRFNIERSVGLLMTIPYMQT